MVNAADPVGVVRAQLAEWDVPHVELAIFESSKPEAIVEAVDAFCREHLDAGVAGYLFCVSSVGSAHGIRLADGRDVVLKVRPPAAENPYLHMDQRTLGCVVAVMRWLHQGGYPCAEPLAGPLPLGRGLA